MAMKMLEAGGIPLVVDGVRVADVDNPKGYFELEQVKDLVKEQDWSWLKGIRGKGIKIISYLLKELPSNYNYKVLFLRRSLSEILTSQSKMLNHRDEVSHTDGKKILELFESDLWKANYLLQHQPQFESIDVQYSDVLQNPIAQAERIRDFLGVEMPIEKMAEVVDPSLYRNRAEDIKP